MLQTTRRSAARQLARAAQRKTKSLGVAPSYTSALSKLNRAELRQVFVGQFRIVRERVYRGLPVDMRSLAGLLRVFRLLVLEEASL